MRAYDVDIMNLQRAEKIIGTTGGWSGRQLDNGGVAQGQDRDLSTGARWRNMMNVPGEAEYRGPRAWPTARCDGPLFR